MESRVHFHAACAPSDALEAHLQMWAEMHDNCERCAGCWAPFESPPPAVAPFLKAEQVVEPPGVLTLAPGISEDVGTFCGCCAAHHRARMVTFLGDDEERAG